MSMSRVALLTNGFIQPAPPAVGSSPTACMHHGRKRAHRPGPVADIATTRRQSNPSDRSLLGILGFP